MRTIQHRTLDKIDQALKYLYYDRLVHFQLTSQKYNNYRKSQDLGFEVMVSAELYAALQRQFDMFSVFMEFPGLNKDRIDLFVDACLHKLDYRGYIELKMYYSRDPQRYTHDFDKLKRMVITDNDAVAVQIHFNLYQNSKQPNHRLIDGFACRLDTDEYWSNISKIGDDKFHFYRFAFGNR